MNRRFIGLNNFSSVSSCEASKVLNSNAEKIIIVKGYTGVPREQLIFGTARKPVQRNGLIINSDQSVSLILIGVTNPTLWDISWMPDTQVKSVTVIGGLDQAVTGVPKSTKVQFIRNCSNINKYSNVSDKGELDRISMEIYARNSDEIYFIKNELSFIGNDNIACTQPLRSSWFSDRLYHNLERRGAGLREAIFIINGAFKLRANQSDPNEHIITQRRYIPLDPTKGEGKTTAYTAAFTSFLISYQGYKFLLTPFNLFFERILEGTPSYFFLITFLLIGFLMVVVSVLVKSLFLHYAFVIVSLFIFYSANLFWGYIDCGSLNAFIGQCTQGRGMILVYMSILAIPLAVACNFVTRWLLQHFNLKFNSGYEVEPVFGLPNEALIAKKYQFNFYAMIFGSLWYLYRGLLLPSLLIMLTFVFALILSEYLQSDLLFWTYIIMSSIIMGAHANRLFLNSICGSNAAEEILE